LTTKLSAAIAEWAMARPRTATHPNNRIVFLSDDARVTLTDICKPTGLMRRNGISCAHAREMPGSPTNEIRRGEARVLEIPDAAMRPG